MKREWDPYRIVSYSGRGEVGAVSCTVGPIVAVRYETLCSNFVVHAQRAVCPGPRLIGWPHSSLPVLLSCWYSRP